MVSGPECELPGEPAFVYAFDDLTEIRRLEREMRAARPFGAR